MSDANAPRHSTSLRGIDEFAGVRIDSTRWVRGHDFTGHSVAVIGADAQAIRIVPELVRSAVKVKVFQQAPAWVLPRVPAITTIAAAPLGAEAAVRAHLRAQVHDPWLRRRLTPDFRARPSRMVRSNSFYPALQRANCTLVTWPIARIVPLGIRTVEGVEHRFDTIVMCGDS